MRAKKAKKDYTQLVQVTQPPASTVRKFLALLEQSDIDFSEEIGMLTYGTLVPHIYMVKHCRMSETEGQGSTGNPLQPTARSRPECYGH